MLLREYSYKLKLTSYYTAHRRQLLCLSPKRNWAMTSSKSGHETLRPYWQV